MYTFKIADFTCEFKKHQNGSLVIIHHDNNKNSIKNQTKIGINTGLEMYKLEDFKWVVIDEYEGVEGFIKYLLNIVGSTISDDDIKNLVNLTESILKNKEVSLSSSECYVINSQE